MPPSLKFKKGILFFTLTPLLDVLGGCFIDSPTDTPDFYTSKYILIIYNNTSGTPLEASSAL